MATVELDADFLALPLEAVRGAALDRARALGCENADVRVERIRSQVARLRDGRLETSADNLELGIGLRVVHEGSFGFAATVELTPEAAAALVDQAVATARATAPAVSERVELAEEPPHGEVTWASSYRLDPAEVPMAEKVGLLEDWSGRLLRSSVVDHATAYVLAVVEDKNYANLAGTVTTQRRVRVHPVVEATAVDAEDTGFETMRSVAPPAGRGWEYLLGEGWDWDEEIERIPEYLAEKVQAPTVLAGAYDLVIDPSNLWLTIHESIGHATELDRAMGYEAAYAGTSFATFDKLGTLRYGSEVMNVTGDRTVEHGLATVAFDDEGVEGQSFDLVRGGVLVGYQLDRPIARLKGLGRSNGCAFADSPSHIPIQRMANVSLRPSAGPGPSTEELISSVDDGFYVIGDKSWSIDMQRYNFQFTGQRFFKIDKGRLAGQVKDLAYQSRTTDFWGAMEAVGGQSTYRLGGAFNCGKGQPGQVAPVSHGCPSALFRGVNVLNTRTESGR
ncbi:MAG: TldD/PmbA family protein [Acidimicrobiales bacterium]